MLNSSKYKFASSEIDFSHPQIMGIVNVTPDSFSDGGNYFNTQSAINHALKLCDEGASIIDVGGESTRPGSDTVPLNEELERTIPVIKELRKLRKQIVISIDTTKSEVASEALENGADIVNDISGCTFDPKMLDTIKQYNPGLALMHIKGNPKTMQDNPIYQDIIKEIKEFLIQQTEQAKLTGLNKIMIDPGIGFGKSINDNFQIIKQLPEFESLGYPIMIGVSRKSFIGKTLNLDIKNRDVATVIMETISVLKSARIIRTHNVEYCNQLVKLVHHLL